MAAAQKPDAAPTLYKTFPKKLSPETRVDRVYQLTLSIGKQCCLLEGDIATVVVVVHKNDTASLYPYFPQKTYHYCVLVCTTAKSTSTSFANRDDLYGIV